MTRRKLSGFFLFAIACSVGAALIFAGLQPPSAPPAAVGAPQVQTPLWSPRRLPLFFTRAVESAALARAGDSLTKLLTTIVAPDRACVAVDSVGGSLVRIGSGTALTPASTLKLLTATAAIDRLGPDRRFTTRAFTDGADLVVVGGGDPLVATPEYIAFRHGEPRYQGAPFTPLTGLADAIVASGVHAISGALVVDDHIHDTVRYLPDWKPNYGLDGEVGSLGALSVDGGFSQPNGRSPAPDPAMLTGTRLAAMLAARGVTISAGVRRGVASTSAHEIAHVDSPSVSDIVREMLTSSDDYTAEILLRNLAVVPDGRQPATTAAGAAIVAQDMSHLGVPTDGLVMHDGSGLAPNDQATCATLLRLIEVTARPRFAAVDKGLAIAGSSGTLAGRFVGDPLAGKLRAKTGSLNGVVGLVGVIDGPNDLHFAFVANGNFSTAGGAQLQANVASAIGSTPDVRLPAGLVPPP